MVEWTVISMELGSQENGQKESMAECGRVHDGPCIIDQGCAASERPNICQAPFLEFLSFGAEVSSCVTSLGGREGIWSIVGMGLQGEHLNAI